MIRYFKQFLDLCTVKQKNQFVFIVFLMLSGTIMETMGIGLVVPIFSLILDFDRFKSNNLISNYSEFLNNFSYEIIVLFSLLFLIAVFLIKNLILIYIAYQNSKFLNSIKADIEKRLFIKYLNQDYLQYVSKNSAQFVSSIISEARSYAGNIILSFLTLTNEILVLTAILSLLIYLEPKSALFVLTSIGIIFYFLFQKTKKIAKKWGDIRLVNEQQRVQKISEGFNLFKYIKVSKLENFFTDYFSKFNEKVKTAAIIQNTVAQLPRRIIEFFGILTLSVLILFMIYINLSITTIIPIIAAFTVAFYRILPCINLILVSLQNLSHGIATMNLISNDLKNFPINSFSSKKTKMTFDKDLVFRNVNFKYPEKKDFIFKDASIKIRKGETIGISGETGVGKSTLIDILLGLVPIKDAEIKIDNKNYTSNRDLSKLEVGYVPQNIYLIDDSIEKNITLNYENNYEKKLNKVLNVAELSEFVSNQEDGINTLIGDNGLKISGGQKQRIGIARAIYSEPKLLILDEATNGIDLHKEREILKKIISYEPKMTVIIISHKSSSLEFCDKIYEIKDKKVFLKNHVQ